MMKLIFCLSIIVSALLSVSCSKTSSSDAEQIAMESSRFVGSPIVCNHDVYNCPSSSDPSRSLNCREVSEVWNACGPDIHRLDGNNDGRPCESDCP